MNEEAKKQLQDLIDRDFELAQKHIKLAETEGWKYKPNMADTFCFMVCFDLARQLGLDLKGAIPE